jgi:hypothetical protein
MLSVITLNVVILSDVMLSNVMQSDVMLSYVILSVIMLHLQQGVPALIYYQGLFSIRFWDIIGSD